MWLIKYKRIFFVLLAPLAMILTLLARGNEAATERIYSRGVYPVLTGVFSRMTGLVPVSVAEIALVLTVVCLGSYITYMVVRIITEKFRRGNAVLRLVSTLLCLSSLVYFLFVSFCGLNYHRESFALHSGLEVRASSKEELAELCAYLVEEVNAVREQVTEDERGVMQLSFNSVYSAAAYAPTVYSRVEDRYPTLAGHTPRVKPLALSRGMSHLDLVGIYIPFTFEANINADVSAYSIPSSMLHELAHFKGYMREDEANFIAYLVGKESGHADFAYSAYMLALIHTSNALYRADSDLHTQVVNEHLSDGVRRDLAANREYWRQFAGPAATVSTKVNDVYLKTNRQQEGVKSYGRMVDLLLAEHRLEQQG